MRQLFAGGVHPEGRKELSSYKMPVMSPMPEEVIIPLSQHIGAPGKPLVKPGDSVKMGQKIGDGEGMCVPVHASVSGIVTAVEERLHPKGMMSLAIVIKNDGQDTPGSELTPHPDALGLPGEEIVSIISQAGIVGMGGATFPTSIKASSGIGSVDTIIANACECEPYITADDVLLCSRPEQVIMGMKLMMQVLRPKRAVIAIEDNKSEAIETIRRSLREKPVLGIEIKVLPTRYPQGSEKQLIYVLTGRQVPPGKLPKDVGCAVFNAASFASVYKAVFEGKPVTRRIVTVTGEGVKNPQNLMARIGTPLKLLVDAAGGLTDDVWKVLAGGPMMGVPQTGLEAPVVKGTNAIVCLSNAQKVDAPHPKCIRCAKCVTACPMNLQPLYINHYVDDENILELRRLHLCDCIECGCCAYVCPGKLPIVEKSRIGKRLLKEAEMK